MPSLVHSTGRTVASLSGTTVVSGLSRPSPGRVTGLWGGRRHKGLLDPHPSLPPSESDLRRTLPRTLDYRDLPGRGWWIRGSVLTLQDFGPVSGGLRGRAGGVHSPAGSWDPTPVYSDTDSGTDVDVRTQSGWGAGEERRTHFPIKWWAGVPGVVAGRRTVRVTLGTGTSRPRVPPSLDPSS